MRIFVRWMAGQYNHAAANHPDELLEIGMVKNKRCPIPCAVCCGAKALLDASRARRRLRLGALSRTLLEAQLGSSHQQMQTFNQRAPERVFALAAGLFSGDAHGVAAGTGTQPLFLSVPGW